MNLCALVLFNRIGNKNPLYHTNSIGGKYHILARKGDAPKSVARIDNNSETTKSSSLFSLALYEV